MMGSGFVFGYFLSNELFSLPENLNENLFYVDYILRTLFGLSAAFTMSGFYDYLRKIR